MEFWSGFNVPTWLILLASVVVLFYLYVDRKFTYWEKQGIESQTRIEFFKSIFTSINKPFQDSVDEVYKKHGRIFGQCMPAPQLWIAEPELIKDILVKDFPVFHNRVQLDFGDSIVNGMLAFLIDEDWKRIRNLMSPTFTSSRMRKMAYMIKQCGESLSKRFIENAEKGVIFDCKKLLSTFMIDVIASTAFATKLNAQENENHEFVRNAQMVASRNISKFTLLAFAVAPKMVKYFKLEFFPRKLMRYFRNAVLKILEERKEKKARGNDFLQLMMDAQAGILEKSAEDLKEEESEINNYKALPKHKTMTLDEVVAQSVLFFTAGHDTTTTTLTLFCYNLALHPDCQERLLKEVDEVWKKHGDVDFDIVSKMTYLDASLNETLRLHNPGVMLSRVATEDYQLGKTGIKIKKGTSVIIPTHGIHHDPEWFPQPQKYDPERFMPENKHSIRPYTFLPFGEGPRNCIGMRFITMVMKICIVYMLRDVKLVATEETRKPLKFYLGQGMQVEKVLLKVENRKHN